MSKYEKIADVLLENCDQPSKYDLVAPIVQCDFAEFQNTLQITPFVRRQQRYSDQQNGTSNLKRYRIRDFQRITLAQTACAISNACEARGCTWNVPSESGYAACYVPKEKGGYANPHSRIQLNESISNIKQLVTTQSNEFSLYGEDIDRLNVQVSVSGPDMIRLTIRDADKQRYEVPVPIRWQATLPASSIKAKIKFEMTKTINGQVGFRVKRTDTQSIIFDTSFFAEGFIYEDKYIQFITTIPSRNVYGFGKNENLYGTQPSYIAIEEDGQTFGVLIFNSNAQDYKLDEFEDNKSMLTYRTLGGILDILFFAGPRPEDVIRQYESVIGHPYMPPYWSLGFQLCRYGYDTLDNMRAAMQRTLDGHIPLDVMYGDIDYFRNQLDFTWDPVCFNGLPEYVDWLHTQGMRFITILDPAIDSEEPSYDVFTEGQKDDIWVKWPQNKNLQFNETKIEIWLDMYGLLVSLCF
ncbi:unnamed protein product [Rotaria sp. Silwood2]|nr:unnamed protein product [Rotaria sp. Silwood2]CAF4333634.1 unnamed protein product [Rotaria sp. Silwood2]